MERLLALGASRSEATRELLSRSVRLAMTPLLNQMSVVGIVSIPGMMTGQILSGGRPDQAARCDAIACCAATAVPPCRCSGSTRMRLTCALCGRVLRVC